MASKTINITLKIWRQKNAKTKGKIETYKLNDVSTDSSFLEMLDQLNEQLVSQKQEPVAFDHDCREGICGTLFIVHQWASTRARHWNHYLPASHENV